MGISVGRRTRVARIAENCQTKRAFDSSAKFKYKGRSEDRAAFFHAGGDSDRFTGIHKIPPDDDKKRKEDRP